MYTPNVKTLTFMIIAKMNLNKSIIFSFYN